MSKNKTFKVCVNGSRNFNSPELMKSKLDYLLSNRKEPIEIVSGGAIGADTLAEQYAISKNYKSTVIIADWHTYGKSAGARRNAEMVDKSHALVSFWDGFSKGTKMTIEMAKNKGIPVRVIKY